MLVPVISRDGKAPEWVLVELQGKVESLTPEQVSHIGVLLAGQDGKSMQLTVGYHQLEGKKVPLKKPLVILSKVPGGSGAEQPDQQQGADQGRAQGPGDMEVDVDAAGGAGPQGTSYEVLGVVRSQYLFKTRPRALISKPEGHQGRR